MVRKNSLIVGALSIGTIVSVASANPTVRFADTDNNWNGADGFLVDHNADGSYEYTTFCVEVQEAVTLGVEYEYTVSKSVMNRGTQGPMSIDNATGYAIAYIYSQFRTNGYTAIEGLSGLSGLSDSQYRELMQRTIWNKLYGGNTNGFYTQAKVDLLFSAAYGQWDSLHNVRVMNVWVDADNQTGARQDMLTMVPLPSSAGLAGLGLLGLAGVSRRR